ncbi:MAG: hypothetical protein RR307_05735 [Clostridia bacterium]
MERGKLKIFFGYSAGVGKTYAMLIEAHELIAKGMDVVIGYIEPHTRPDTIALCEGIEKIPTKKFNYYGININEFDVDEAILRHPDIILVDELAHTNAENSKHKKRYQDILELINNGINVYTTINVQHIEGLNDIIDSATMVKVGETVPDEIFDKSDDVELIDIEPAELLKRLKSGKIYNGEKINTALENFFTQEHLNNLREVSMRRCADRIVKRNTICENAPKILVLISPSPSSQKNIRIAAQMASNYHCKFTAMYVETCGELDNESAKTLKSHIKLVADLGGNLIIKYGESVVETIETYVKINGITNIVIGKTWQSIGKKIGLEEQIISVLPNIEVLIIPDKQSSASQNKKSKLKFNTIDKIFVAVFAIILLVFICLTFINKWLALSCLSVLSVTLFVFLMFERKAKLTLNYHFRQSNKMLDCINLLTEKNNWSKEQDIVSHIANIIAETFERSVLIYVNNKSIIQNYNDEDLSFLDSVREKSILNWCVVNNKPAGIGTDTLRNALAIYFPLELTNKNIACIAFSCAKSKLSVTDKMLFSQIKNTIAILLEINFDLKIDFT